MVRKCERDVGWETRLMSRTAVLNSNPFRPNINKGIRDGIMNVEIELNYAINKPH